MAFLNIKDLPKPKCRYGYTDDQVKEIFGIHYGEFNKWMRGATRMLCGGWLYNHDTGEYEPSPCAAEPHGGITYVTDVRTFIAVGPRGDND